MDQEDAGIVRQLRERQDDLSSRAANALTRLWQRYLYLEHDYADTLASRAMDCDGDGGPWRRPNSPRSMPRCGGS